MPHQSVNKLNFGNIFFSHYLTRAVTRDVGRVQGAPHNDTANVWRAVVSLGANPLLFQVVDANRGVLAASQLLPSSGQPVIERSTFVHVRITSSLEASSLAHAL